MVTLKSVSNPIESLESAVTGAERRKVMAGRVGSAPAEVARATERLLVVGKSEPLMRSIDSGRRNVLETVLGEDDRTRILETEADPWRMICALRIRTQFGMFIGSGWFVGPKTIITAGHCVHDSSQMGGWAARVDVSPGRDDAEFPFGTVSSARFSTLDRWIESRDPDFDIGCIHLDEPLGDTVGWFSVATIPAEELSGFQVNISGYPGDRGGGREQWFHSNRVLRVTARRIFYDVDTFGGQSGSPVWIYQESGGGPVVIGIHAYGVGGTPSDFGITANSSPRIIREVLDQIEQWRAEDDNQ